jgi:hypothetical protein
VELVPESYSDGFCPLILNVDLDVEIVVAAEMVVVLPY